MRGEKHLEDDGDGGGKHVLYMCSEMYLDTRQRYRLPVALLSHFEIRLLSVLDSSDPVHWNHPGGGDAQLTIG